MNDNEMTGVIVLLLLILSINVMAFLLNRPEEVVFGSALLAFWALIIMKPHKHL